jgi:hypothetical protein
MDISKHRVVVALRLGAVIIGAALVAVLWRVMAALSWPADVGLTIAAALA